MEVKATCMYVCMYAYICIMNMYGQNMYVCIYEWMNEWLNGFIFEDNFYWHHVQHIPCYPDPCRQKFAISSWDFWNEDSTWIFMLIIMSSDSSLQLFLAHRCNAVCSSFTSPGSCRRRGGFAFAPYANYRFIQYARIYLFFHQDYLPYTIYVPLWWVAWTSRNG